MFRRKWSGLPADPSFPEDLKELGYFINEQDEVRNIQDPRFYFKYFISKNERWNERQRFAMNTVLEREIHSRLTALGLSTLRLPAGAGPADPHVPILASSTLATASRVVLVVGESAQDLGVLAYRVVGGPGGVAHGSMVSVATLLLGAQAADAAAPPALVLANTGQLFWWPAGRRALSPAARHGVPCSSAASRGIWFDPARHQVPGCETPDAHLRLVFGAVRDRAPPDAKLSVVALGDGAECVERFLNDEGNWSFWGPRMQSLVLVGGFFEGRDVVVEGFRKFLKERARAYIVCPAAVGTPIAGPEGNINSSVFTDYGCPVYSSGETYLNELMFVNAKEHILEWIQEVTLAGDKYRNPKVYTEYADKQHYDEEEERWAGGNGNDGGLIEVVKLEGDEIVALDGGEEDDKENREQSGRENGSKDGQ